MVRLLVTVSVLLALAAGGFPVIAAQDATPSATEPILAGLGYPELLIEVDEDTTRVPEQVPAGRTLITLANIGEESWHGFLLRLPEGVTPDALQATPEPGQEDAPPPWLFEATFPGFPGETLPGQTNRAVVDLTPGDYLVVGDVFQPFLVVGDAATPAAGEDPAADGVVRLFEYNFELPEVLAPGPQVWELTNTGEQPHELLLAWSPKPVTAEQVVQMFMNENEDENATPIGGGPSFAEIEPVGGMGWLSPGATAWTEVDLRPGTYIALCFVFDPATGMPHVAMGMVAVFTVGGDGGTPAP